MLHLWFLWRAVLGSFAAALLAAPLFFAALLALLCESLELGAHARALRRLAGLRLGVGRHLSSIALVVVAAILCLVALLCVVAPGVVVAVALLKERASVLGRLCLLYTSPSPRDS